MWRRDTFMAAKDEMQGYLLDCYLSRMTFMGPKIKGLE